VGEDHEAKEGKVTQVQHHKRQKIWNEINLKDNLDCLYTQKGAKDQRNEDFDSEKPD
jgi:hypothetical protein